MDSDKKAIRELIATWMRITGEGDPATVRTMLSDDVVFLLPGQPPLRRDAFAARIALTAFLATA